MTSSARATQAAPAWVPDLRRLGGRVHVEHLRAHPPTCTDWPGWAAPSLLERLRASGIHRLYSHQAEAAELAHAGRHVVVATGTASGKSMAYLLPAVTDLTEDRRATTLYLAPTKALAADQLTAVVSLGPDLGAAVCDGDTSMEVRDWIRAHSRWLLTNPDLLHRTMLPHHDRWARFFRRLRYVVVDECHAYRGVFGSHVALVLRRLMRVAAMYGASPTAVFASATVANPAVAAHRLLGEPVAAVTSDGAPRGPTEFMLWQPPDAIVEAEDAADPAAADPAAADPAVADPAVADPEVADPEVADPAAADPEPSPFPFGSGARPARRSAPAEGARLLADLVAHGARALLFVRSRVAAEQAALATRRRLQRIAPHLAAAVASYRGGYLPEDRRAVESALRSGQLRAMTTTNALELGVDIAGLDAVVIAGFPGSLASIWQQAGRAGRSAGPSLVVFIAREDPLDTYLAHHPQTLFDRSVEASITFPGNPRLLGPHLRCAAAEHHLTVADLQRFGPTTQQCVADLVAAELLRARSDGWYRVDARSPASEVDLRGSGGDQVVIVEQSTARLLGTVDVGRAPSTVHPGAVYLHQGVSFVVESLDFDDRIALVREDQPTYSTAAQSVSSVRIVEVLREGARGGGVRSGLARVDVVRQVVGFERRTFDGSVLDATPLDMPAQQLDTEAVFYTVPPAALADVGVEPRAVPGALHAAEHAAIGLLPLFTSCDRSDIGGLSTDLHPDTGEPTVLVYDSLSGGAGFAERGFEVLTEWLAEVAKAVQACPCAAGCPSCVQSPKCGNGNDPLDKAGAVRVLRLVAEDAGGPNAGELV